MQTWMCHWPWLPKRICLSKPEMYWEARSLCPISMWSRYSSNLNKQELLCSKKRQMSTFYKHLKIKGRVKKKVWKIPHLLLKHPSTPKCGKKQKKHVVFWLISSFGTKKCLKFFHLATHHCHPLEPLTATTHHRHQLLTHPTAAIRHPGLTHPPL